MRRLNLALLATLAVLAGPASLLAQAAAPKAVVPEPVKDFGVVARGEKISYDFVIRNEGTAPLTLTDVRPACGCTVASFDEAIAPGQQGRVHADVETSTFDGPIAKAISVFTNDPANARIELVVKAHIQPYLDVSPGYARFNYVQGEEIRPITQRLWASDGAAFQIVAMKPPYNHVKVSQREATAAERKADAAGSQFLIDVIIDPNSPVGQLDNYVEVAVDHPRQKLVKIPISGFVRPRQHVTPSSLDMGQVEASALPLSRSAASLVSFITAAIEVTGVSSDVVGLSGRVEPVDATGHRFRLLVEASPELAKGPFAGTLKLSITDPKNPVVAVPIKGVVL